MNNEIQIQGLTREELVVMLHEAAEHGATNALKKIGLSDDDAIHDVRELRNLLDSWRSTKKQVWKTTIGVFTVAILGFIAGASFLKFKSIF
jgi:hypothetical protein